MVLEREHWTTRLGFILAAAGSAVGLGNIWRFPFITGQMGGAMFLLIYLVTVLLIGYPMMITEITLGKKAQKNPLGTFKELAPDTPWWLVGALVILTAFIIMSYYSVVAGWAMHYSVESATGLPEEGHAEVFIDHISGMWLPTLYHAIFMGLTAGIVALGVVKGIQRTVKLLMPILFILILVVIGRAVTLDGAMEGLEFYLSPELGDVTIESLNAAIGQAFFTLSLGMGIIITYGSYLDEEENVADNAASVVGLDTLVAILAGFAIFPAVFAMGFDPGEGAGLTFITLPAVFAEMPAGSFFAFLFFVLLTIAALTSAISLTEVVVSWLIDEYGWARMKAAALIGTLMFLFGIPPILGYGAWDGFEFYGMDILDTYDFWADSIMLPLGGLLVAIFAGYVFKANNVADEANRTAEKIKVGKWFAPLVRYLIPIAIAVIITINLWETFVGPIF